MIVVLALSVGEGVGLVRQFNAQALMFNPLYILIMYAVGLSLAPKLYESTPISGDAPRKDLGLKQPLGYGLRVAVLAAMGLVLALFANLIAYLLGEFT